MSIRERDANAPTPQNLVKKYRPIGPAAIAAAVAATAKRKPKFSRKPFRLGFRLERTAFRSWN